MRPNPATPARPARRRLWVVVSLLVLALFAVGAVWVFKRGSGRSELPERVARALRAGDFPAAESILRDLLRSQPEDAKVRRLLIRVLVEQKKYDEADRVAKDWAERPGGREDGTKTLVELAIRRGRFAEADLLARSISDLDPRFAQFTLLGIREIMGDAASLWDAQNLAVNLASFAAPGAERVELYLRAAEAVLDVRPEVPESSRPRLDALAAKYVGEAEAARRSAPPAGTPDQVFASWIRILQDSPAGRDAAEAALRSLVKGKDRRPSAILAAHFTRAGKWDDAEALLHDLRDEPLPVWLRAVRRVSALGRRDIALRLLAEGTNADHPLTILFRAGLLVRGTQEDRADAAKRLTDLASRLGFDATLCMEAAGLLHGAGLMAEVVDLLSRAIEAHPSIRLEVRLAAVLASQQVGGDKERALRIVEGIPARLTTAEEASDAVRAARVGGPELLRRLGQASLGEGREVAARRVARFLAFATLAAGESDPAIAEVARSVAVADSEALAQADIPKADLARASVLALSLGIPGVAGQLVARTLTLDGSPYEVALLCLAIAENTKDESLRGAFASGLEAAAAGPASGLVRSLATAIRAGADGRKAVLEGTQPGGTDAASVHTLFLRARVLMMSGDPERAEAEARRLVELLPGTTEAREVLGDVLLARKRYEDVLRLTDGVASTTLASDGQRMTALFATGKREAAVDLARASLRRHPTAEPAYIRLADLHEASGRTDEALAVLNVAPPSRAVEIRRALLLLRKHDVTAAEMTYNGILARIPRDLDAWWGLSRVTSEGGAGAADLLARLDRELASTELKADDPSRAQFLVLRGLSNEQVGRVSEALRDYEAAIQISPKDVTALNNASWILCTREPKDLAKAQDYIDRALAAAPDQPNVSDTAANVYAELGKIDVALHHIDQTLRLVKKPSYMLTRAKLLLRSDKPVDAKAQLLELVSKYSDAPEAVAARDLLRAEDERK